MSVKVDVMSRLQSQDYRAFLGIVFLEKKKRNKRYSLRAFAKSLGMSHSYLSSIMNGKKELTLDRAKEIVARLNLDPSEAQFFLELVQGTSNKRGRSRLSAESLKSTEFSVFSHWYNIV